MSSLRYQVLLLAFLVGALFVLVHERATLPASVLPPISSTTTQAASAETPFAATSSPVKTEQKKNSAVTKVAATPPKTLPQSHNTASSSSENIASRVENPYETPPLPFADINTVTRSALVNIFCTPHGGGLHPISGSGVIIDPRGVILTNAHVAQYVLLSESAQVNLDCAIRMGSPASAQYIAQVLYIPSAWISLHASEINNAHPLGTGEHDYALLTITAAANGSPLPPTFPSVSPDTREAIAFVDDDVLVASYPAELAAGSVQMSLYPASSVTTIDRLFTFGTGSVDVVSVGGVIEAQSGSSGGAIVNAWGRLVGLITTTSEGTTTSERDLRAITASYINRDLLAQSGGGLSSLLAGDILQKTEDFTAHGAVTLLQSFAPYLKL